MEMGEAISGLDSLNELLGSQALVHGGQMVVSALAVVAKAEEQPTELSGEVSAAAPVADPALQAEVEEGV